jgi:DNA mismatch endonuclease (patch repair protein)
MDVLTAEQRHRCMARIKGRNTKPEVQLRKALWQRGFRYRLHDRSLPGTPDLVLPRFRAVVFVHGCFWHGHECALFVVPATNTDFWTGKIGGNRERDRRALGALGSAGWRVCTVWECALRGPERSSVDDVADRVAGWLRSRRRTLTLPTRRSARA